MKKAFKQTLNIAPSLKEQYKYFMNLLLVYNMLSESKWKFGVTNIAIYNNRRDLLYTYTFRR